MNSSSYNTPKYLYPHVYGTFHAEILNQSYSINREFIPWVFGSWFKNILDMALEDTSSSFCNVDMIPEEYEYLIWLDIMIEVSITTEIVSLGSIRFSGRWREDAAFSSVREGRVSELLIRDKLALKGASNEIDQHMKDSLLELLADNQEMIYEWVLETLKGL